MQNTCKNCSKGNVKTNETYKLTATTKTLTSMVTNFVKGIQYVYKENETYIYNIQTVINL